MSSGKLNHRVSNLERAVHGLEQLANGPGKQDHKTVERQRDTRQEGEHAPGAPPIIAPRPADTSDTKKKGDNAIPWWKTVISHAKRARWRKVLQTVGIVAGIVYAAVTYLQWRDLRHNFEVDQRAWLRVEYALPNTPICRFSMMVTNFGKSPARSSVDTWVGIIAANKAPAPEFAQSYIRVNEGMMFPGQKDNFPAGLSNLDGSLRDLTSAEVGSLLAGKTYIAVFGHIRYEDQFGLHWTRFCNWRGYAPPPAIFHTGACTAADTVGDGEPPTGWPTTPDSVSHTY